LTDAEASGAGAPEPNSPQGIDGLTRFLGMRWDSAETVRIEVRDDLINPAGLLSGPVAYALVDYSMGSALWAQKNPGERIATINISINLMQMRSSRTGREAEDSTDLFRRTAREGEVTCTSRVHRRNDRVAVLSSEVRDSEDRLLATAIGSFSIPSERAAWWARAPDIGSRRNVGAGSG
jgi:acyl-coenzyme A thioesterase PaaI-like protein